MATSHIVNYDGYRASTNREYWTAECSCGWWTYGQVSRRAAWAAIERHTCRHRKQEGSRNGKTAGAENAGREI